MNLLFQQIANTTVTEILCSTQMDGIVLDTEHGYFNNETLVDCIRVIKLSGKQAFVRMKIDQQLAQLCIDNSINGIILSDVRYPSDSIKEYIGCGLVKNNFWGMKDLSTRKTSLIAQIESREAIDRIEDNDWLFVYDYLMIGMYDLSQKYGCFGDFDNRKFMEAIERFEKNVGRKRRGIHLVKDIDSDYDKYKDYGLKGFSLDTLGILDRVKELNKYV